MCIRDREEEEEEGDEEPASALPQGFFDDQQADDKAHGRDLEAEMQEKLKSFEETMQTEQFEANLREASGAREQEETQELEEETTEYMEETVDQQIDFLSKMESLSLIHISEPTRLLSISYAVFCLKKKKNNTHGQKNSRISLILIY
eukprot:TRINITY_DN2962_c0_g1_i1.p1 TRINITY_DN2962_c0_g1~~TRINITY_DN2962_c0_g1_i1.p1  ORF type:complete len:147 (+),score=61.28 TRINITY_DN2962_c0_g1_i1:130-570(+)